MVDLLFNPPLYLLVGLLLVGAVLLYNGLSRGVRGVQVAGVAAITVAVLAYVAGRLVETGPERVERLTAAVVTAADRRDWNTFSGLLDPKVSLYRYGDREQLVAGAKLTMDRVGVKDVTIGNVQAQAEPGGYTVAFTATADIEFSGRRTPTDWKFYWAEAATKEGYQLYKIEILPNAQFGTEPITSRLATP